MLEDSGVLPSGPAEILPYPSTLVTGFRAVLLQQAQWGQLDIELEDLESGDFRLVVVTHASTLEAERGRHL